MNFVDKEGFRILAAAITSCIVAYYTVKNIENLTIIFNGIKTTLGL
ncbi:MAG: hypothetical protein ACRCW9_01820 [Cetobacterium sp.]